MGGSLFPAFAQGCDQQGNDSRHKQKPSRGFRDDTDVDVVDEGGITNVLGDAEPDAGHFQIPGGSQSVGDGHDKIAVPVIFNQEIAQLVLGDGEGQIINGGRTEAGVGCLLDVLGAVGHVDEAGAVGELGAVSGIGGFLAGVEDGSVMVGVIDGAGAGGGGIGITQETEVKLGGGQGGRGVAEGQANAEAEGLPSSEAVEGEGTAAGDGAEIDGAIDDVAGREYLHGVTPEGIAGVEERGAVCACRAKDLDIFPAASGGDLTGTATAGESGVVEIIIHQHLCLGCDSHHAADCHQP